MTDRRRPRGLALVLGLGGMLVIALLALGSWQVQRRAWKLDLIARVEARVHGAPVAVSALGGDFRDDEYRRVRLTGRFMPGAPTLVQALTERGAGYWVMMPLATSSGPVVLVNRGFVPTEPPGLARAAPGGETSITGLVRLTEPKGGFLRSNDPAADRWFSRDVAAIAKHRGIVAAPYFVDADATPNPGGYPIGGMTVIRFPNNHLVYAITWYALAAMVAGAMVMVVRSGKRSGGQDG